VAADEASDDSEEPSETVDGEENLKDELWFQSFFKPSDDIYTLNHLEFNLDLKEKLLTH
jgi:hypothetical protein